MNTKQFFGLQLEDQVALWNEYCESIEYYDDMIYPNTPESLAELFKNTSWAIALGAKYGDWNPAHHYFYVDAYGHFYSFDSLEYGNGKELIDLDNLLEFATNQQS